jgi:acyl-CoA synthetase (NDP forming)
MTRPRLEDVVGRLVMGRSAGETLPEHEAQRITAALGIAVPTSVLVFSPVEAASTALPGHLVVLKLVGPAHKSDLGGVQIVENAPGAIRGAAGEMAIGPEGLLVAEFVTHEAEILAGVRWTDAFGPVVTIGVGGVDTETSPDPAFLAMATLGAAGEAFRLAPGTRALVEGRRGSAPVTDSSTLADLASRLLELGECVMPNLLTEFEMNPVVISEGRTVALDALAVVGSRRETAPPRPVGAIAHQLRPETIAVVGVSERMNPGRMIVRNILGAGFPAERLTIIKPGLAELDGCRCVPSVADLDEPVDLLVVAVAAGAVEELMGEAMGQARSVILIPGGVGERPGTEPVAARIRASISEARRADSPAPVVSGPNSMGVRSVPGHYDATFIPGERMTPGTATDHPVAVVAQSGAFTLSRLDRLPWLRPRYVVTVGNQIDLTVADYLEFFADDTGVSLVGAYVEGFAPGDGSRALAAAGRLRSRGGLMLWYRGGRTPEGARSAASHTAAIATDDRVARALGEAAGVLEAHSLDDFDDLLRMATLFAGKEIAGGGVGVVSNAGFECVVAADALGRLAAADLSSTTATRVGALLSDEGLREIAGVGNPLDLTPIAGDEVFAEVVEAVLDDPGVGVGVIGCVPYSPAIGMLPADVEREGSLIERLSALAAHPKPWVAVIDAGRLYDPAADRLEAVGVPVIRSMDRAVRLLGQYASCRLGRTR